MSFAVIQKNFRNLSQHTAALSIAGISAAVLAGAWFFQLVMKLEPCDLCLPQRIPYYAAVPLGITIAYVARTKGGSSLARLGLYALALIMIAGAGLGIHHAGVEWGWWAGPNTCSGGTGGAGGTNFLEELKKGRVIPCNEAAFRFLGISLAGYNAIIAAALAVLAFAAARKN